MPTKRRRRQLLPADARADVEREGHELAQSGSNISAGAILGHITPREWGDAAEEN
jgi:hypothetical protein